MLGNRWSERVSISRRLVRGAAGGGVRGAGCAFVGGEGVSGFAFAGQGQLSLASGAGVPGHFLGGGFGENLAGFDLAVHLGREDVGTLGAGHEGQHGGRGSGRRFRLI